ncbi:unnamed protein product [Phytophthora lilii]|uniref:Unnamed protein product n=1 Tax=Phytophthora lilii TaxID=2077276 RepID=A0A9W6UD24_9STRA|nr:unnamed protein product [Phytophthora lilii]
MRSNFFVSLIIAVFARSNVVAAFMNSDESQVLSKHAPEFTADAVVDIDSRKSFLRLMDPDDDGREVAQEEPVRLRVSKRFWRSWTSRLSCIRSRTELTSKN